MTTGFRASKVVKVSAGIPCRKKEFDTKVLVMYAILLRSAFPLHYASNPHCDH